MKSKRSFSLTLAALERSLENGTMILYQFVLVNVMLVSTLSAVLICAAAQSGMSVEGTVVGVRY